MKKIFITMLMGVLAFSSASAQSTSVYAYTNNTLECLGVDLDGSQTLRVSGIGRRRSFSREQCKKNAVWAVIFKGIQNGMSGCNTKPLILEPNAEEKYEDYFNRFFSEGGDYIKYASMDDTKHRSQVKAKSKTMANYTYTVKVLRPQLKERLIQDGIIKSNK